MGGFGEIFKLLLCRTNLGNELDCKKMVRSFFQNVQAAPSC